MTDSPHEDAAPAVEDADVTAPELVMLEPADLGLDLPEDPVEARQTMLHALAVSRQEAGEYLETMQRVAAEFDNFRKRSERDRGELVQRATQRLIADMLPTLDNFDAALVYDPQTPAEEKILDGMRSTRSQLLELLESQGLLPIEAMGAPFDPAVHEAVAGPVGGDGELIVNGEMRRGYTLSGMVLRAALVSVESTAETDD